MDGDGPALTRAFPGLKPLPRFELGRYPTPAQPVDLKVVVPAFRGSAWIKREDLVSEPPGGNKIRKLEYLLGEARARGRRTIVTTGGIGSSHCLVSAFYGPEAGLKVRLVMFPHTASPVTRRTLRAIAALGPHITYCPAATASPAVAAAVFARLTVMRERPFLIPPGGCSVTGTLGMVDAGLELAEQISRGELDAPDAVFTAYGAGGTAAGLAVGLQAGGPSPEVVAVRAFDLPATSTTWLRSLAERTARRIRRLSGERLPFDASRLRVAGDYLGGGYAEPTPEGSAAAEIAGELGITVETTYTAKAFAAFLDAAASPAYRDRKLLFVLTYDSRLPEGLLDGDATALLPRPLRQYA